MRAAYRDKLEEWSTLLAGALSSRLGVDPATTVEPRPYARVAMAVVAVTTELWEATGRTDDIEELLDRAFALEAPDERRPHPRNGRPALPPPVPAVSGHRLRRGAAADTRRPRLRAWPG